MHDSVLIAEGDPFNLRLLEQVCEEAGFSVVTAGDADTALNLVARQRPALIVLDARLASDDGAGVLEVLVSDPELRAIPVLVTTAADDDAARRMAVSLGAADFVTRPFRVWEIEHRVRMLLRLAAAERAAVSSASALPTRMDDGLDPLTRAGGAAQLRISVEYEATRAVRYGHPLTALVLRIENFSAIVSAAGEETGSGLLRQLAENLRRSVRGIDHLFRADTDEFVLLLPETDADGAAVVMGRLREEAREQSLAGYAIEPPAQLSLGHGSIQEGSPIRDGDALLRAARDTLEAIES